VHGFADVQHGVEDDRVSGELHLVSAREKKKQRKRGHALTKEETLTKLNKLLSGSYLMKTSMMDLQTSTLTLSFWNMSRNGRKRS